MLGHTLLVFPFILLTSDPKMSPLGVSSDCEERWEEMSGELENVNEGERIIPTMRPIEPHPPTPQCLTLLPSLVHLEKHWERKAKWVEVWFCNHISTRGKDSVILTLMRAGMQLPLMVLEYSANNNGIIYSMAQFSSITLDVCMQNRP